MSPAFLRGVVSGEPDESTHPMVEDDLDPDEALAGLMLVEASSVAFSDPDDDDRVWIGWVRSSLRDTLLVEMIDERSAGEMPGEVHGSTAIDSAYVTFLTRVVRHDGAWVTFEAPGGIAGSNRRGLFRVPAALRPAISDLTRV